jgi:hypothetical protein
VPQGFDTILGAGKILFTGPFAARIGGPPP